MTGIVGGAESGRASALAEARGGCGTLRVTLREAGAEGCEGREGRVEGATEAWEAWALGEGRGGSSGSGISSNVRSMTTLPSMVVVVWPPLKVGTTSVKIAWPRPACHDLLSSS